MNSTFMSDKEKDFYSTFTKSDALSTSLQIFNETKKAAIKSYIGMVKKGTMSNTQIKPVSAVQAEITQQKSLERDILE